MSFTHPCLSCCGREAVRIVSSGRDQLIFSSGAPVIVASFGIAGLGEGAHHIHSGLMVKNGEGEGKYGVRQCSIHDGKPLIFV
ncbi:hypothetical protein DM819_07060 [Pseudomonas hunanensis]|uniref:Uncharacterized protein n=1 Tax=Pseudomonas hunanensis TaxID=1247546 RepID=A0ABD6MVQ7_9PSED|nr:hypothetical protein [Pseudomonas hunanensis]